MIKTTFTMQTYLRSLPQQHNNGMF